MKIAYFVDRFPLVSETFILGQLVGMLERGHDVRIFANWRAATDVVHPVVLKYGLLERTTFVTRIPRHFISRIIPAVRVLLGALAHGHLKQAARALNVARFGRSAMSLRLLLRAAPHFRDSQFDIIHCQFGHLGVGLPVLIRCGALQGVLVTSFRGTDAMKFATRDPARFADLFESGNRFLCVSSAVKERLISLGCAESKIDILRSGIDLNKFVYREQKDLNDPVQILSVGRLAPNKGIEFAIRAIRLVVDAGCRVQYGLLGDGPSRISLQKLVNELGLTDVVTFAGAVNADCVAETLQQSDILVVPSITGPSGEQEGLPNSPKEAMACGVLVIATQIGGIPELINDGVNGYLVEERDAEAIANRLLSAMGHWPEQQGLLAEARQTIEEEFEIDHLNDQLEQTYRSVMG